LAAGDVSLGHCSDWIVLPVHGSLRENIEDEVIPMMIYLTAVVVAFLFVYLVAALIRPEWF
jgi:K+-transporting ATPase KdpF subunit